MQRISTKLTLEDFFVSEYFNFVFQEVDDPSPNFIVVYDLQSGTLFKKWKPGVNSVSLDISSKDSCVISGHQNGTISVWDIVTGTIIPREMG